jgi:uncharacterized glyoxalase superfamily protein PhnB
MWTDVVPQLAVRDVRAAQQWYRERFGFEADFNWEDDYGGIHRGDVRIYLCREGQARPSLLCVTVEDVDAAYARCLEAGTEILSEPEDKPWGIREFTCADPDGNRFRLGRGLGE